MIHSDVSPCVLSVDWKSTDCNSDYERFVLFERFFLFFPAPIVVLSREFVYAMSQCLWFRRIVGLSLVFFSFSLPDCILADLHAGTTQQGFTRLLLFSASCFEFRIFRRKFRRISGEFGPRFSRERSFFPSIFQFFPNGCARF